MAVQTLNDRKKAFGAGWRKNKFFISMKIPTPVFSSITKKTDKDGNTLINKDKLNLFISGHKTDPVWVGLAVETNLPSFVIERGQPIFHHTKFPTKIEHGDITIDFLNDQWNVNYMFWFLYINYMVGHGQVFTYPEDYQIDIKVEFLDNVEKTFQTWTFKRCYPFNLPDRDYKYGKADIDQFKVDFHWVDFEIETTPIIESPFIIAGNLNNKNGVGRGAVTNVKANVEELKFIANQKIGSGLNIENGGVEKTSAPRLFPSNYVIAREIQIKALKTLLYGNGRNVNINNNLASTVVSELAQAIIVGSTATSSPQGFNAVEYENKAKNEGNINNYTQILLETSKKIAKRLSGEDSVNSDPKVISQVKSAFETFFTNVDASKVQLSNENESVDISIGDASNIDKLRSVFDSGNVKVDNTTILDSDELQLLRELSNI